MQKLSPKIFVDVMRETGMHLWEAHITTTLARLVPKQSIVRVKYHRLG